MRNLLIISALILVVAGSSYGYYRYEHQIVFSGEYRLLQYTDGKVEQLSTLSRTVTRGGHWTIVQTFPDGTSKTTSGFAPPRPLNPGLPRVEYVGRFARITANNRDEAWVDEDTGEDLKHVLYTDETRRYPELAIEAVEIK